MAGIADILGNPTLEQIFVYGVIQQLVGAALGPYLQALANELQSVTPNVPLSPADAATAVIRNIQGVDAAAGEAQLSGINRDRFDRLVALAGNAPDPTSLAVALRRGFVDEARYEKGIAQGALRDEWSDVVKELAVQEPSPMDAMTALVEGQLDEATARAKFAAFGGQPSEFDWLFGTVGAGPSPLEAAQMAYRGVIPWTGKGLGVVSFEQAVAEGHTRNKWEPAYRALSEYLPPPRTITAMHREGALTTEQAAKLLADHGLPADLAAAYLLSSSKAKTAKARELAESTVLTLYRDRLIPRDEAETFIERLGYSTEEAGFILAAEDLRVTERFMVAAVGRIHTYYIGHKISATAAATALADLRVESAQAAELVALWDHERAANVKRVTPAEVATAFMHSIIDQGTAQSILESDGYSPYDAWLLLSVHNKGPLPNAPSPGALGPAAGP